MGHRAEKTAARHGVRVTLREKKKHAADIYDGGKRYAHKCGRPGKCRRGKKA